jgi:diguanylate cyclase (GGDEF)-like protein
MTSNPDKSAAPLDTTASLGSLLDRSEQVVEKVEQAAVDLSSVNESLKDKIAVGVPLVKVEGALNKSEAVEVQVQEAAADLASVNDALADEIDMRHQLEEELSTSDAKLAKSRAELRKANQSALHDAITGLPNLTLFNDRLRVALAQAERHAWRLAVMFIDLDKFKAVNDAHGHQVGDRVLQTVAERLKTIVRSGDTVSRRSGDEFLFLMLEAKEDANVLALAARIGEALGKPYDIDGVTLTVQASVGIALYPDDARGPAELLQHADTAMYAAKEQRTGAVLYGKMPAATPPA